MPKDKSLWREVVGPKLYPDPEMLRDKGRLMSTRIRNEMNWRESQPKPKCGVCHEEGHNRRRCQCDSRINKQQRSKLGKQCMQFCDSPT